MAAGVETYNAWSVAIVHFGVEGGDVGRAQEVFDVGLREGWTGDFGVEVAA